MEGRNGHDIGFIPACAGNAPVSEALNRGVAVHPRVRGERKLYAEQFMVQYGSSPRARGTLLRVERLDFG